MLIQDCSFTVSYVGFDGMEHSQDYQDLQTAQSEATWLEERGCHTITIADDDGNECAR